MKTDAPILLSPEEQAEWAEGVRAREVIDVLRAYLKQYSLDVFSSELRTTEAVRDRVLFFLDEYRRLNTQQPGKYSVITNVPGTGAFTGTVHTAFDPRAQYCIGT